MIKHILFDCDGVLIDTEIVAANLFVARMQAMGINDISTADYLTNHTGSTFMTVLGQFLDHSHSLTEQREIMEEIEQAVADNVVEISGVEQMLKSVSIDKSIVSNSYVKAVKNAMHKTGLTSYFTGNIFSSELVKNPKPATDVYELAIQTTNLEPNQLLVVEDSLTGVRAAKSAGLQVIGFLGASHILPGHDERMRDLGVTKLAYNMAELDVILNQQINQ